MQRHGPAIDTAGAAARRRHRVAHNRLGVVHRVYGRLPIVDIVLTGVEPQVLDTVVLR